MEIARFVTDGYLRFDAVVPDEVNEVALEEIKEYGGVSIFFGGAIRPDSGTPLSDLFSDLPGLRSMLDVPEVAGAIFSLVGATAVFDHLAVHHNPPGQPDRQHLHADAAIDASDPTFDIQLFYFPHDVPPDSGGTRFVPGTHLRRVHENSVARYQHLNGEQFFTGPAGTVMIFHHGMWHAGHNNPSDSDRWMIKVRLNPTEPQVRLWDDLDYDTVTPPNTDHAFATMAEGPTVANELRRIQAWSFNGESRLELMERVRLWRYLSGDPTYDVDWYHTRIERRAALLDRPD